MDGDLPALAPSGAMVTGVLTAWPWDAASAMGKVGLWAPQGRRGPAAQGGGGGHGRKKSLYCHPFRAQQAYKAILALESTNGIGGSGWLTLAPYPARMVLTHCLPVSFHSRVKGQRPGCKVNTLLRAFPARAWPGSIYPGHHPVAAPGLGRGETPPWAAPPGPLCVLSFCRCTVFILRPPHPLL